MRRLWLTFLALSFASVYLSAQSGDQTITVTGKLSRVVAVGGESTGWAIEFDSATAIDGKQLNSIQVIYSKAEKLEKLADKHVKAVGQLTHRQGVETGEQPVLAISSLKEIGAAAPSSSNSTFNLSGSEWVLEDIAGSAVLDNVQATLAFEANHKVAGHGSCNRFFGSAEIDGDRIKFGNLGSTRMACPEAVMNQETKYLQALQGAERLEWQDGHLLIHCKGLEKPLRFARVPLEKPSTQ